MEVDNCSLRSQMQAKMDPMDIWDSEEDDLFYEELRRQVLLLTAEDDEESLAKKHPNAAKTLHHRFNATPSSAALQPGCYYYWSGSEAGDSVPRWLFSLWNSGSGTGVFIPQIKSRRRYKPKRRVMKEQEYTSHGQLPM